MPILKIKTALLLLFSLSGFLSCRTSTHTDMSKEKNALLCDPESGICEIPASDANAAEAYLTAEKPLKVIYFTDPICSSCWGIEPQLRKLKLEYPDLLEIEYRMGGLLPDWSYNSGGISKPSDVAHHWDEVSRYYDMPIDGDVWLEDPLDSSYPPSIAFKAAQLQDQKKALLFLREMREMVFLKKKNIAKWENIGAAALRVGLDTQQLKTDINGKGKDLFYEDLELAKSLRVRGFPSMIFVDTLGKQELVYGSKPYSAYEEAILRFLPNAAKKEYGKSITALFGQYTSLTAREFAELSGVSRSESEKTLNQYVSEGVLEKFTCKNGSLWTLKK